MVLLFFKVFSYMRSYHLSKHFFHSDWDTSKILFLKTPIVYSSSGNEDRWACIFFLIINATFCQKGAGLSRCVRARIVVVKNELSSLVRFSNFFKDFIQVEEWPHDQFCRRNRPQHLLRSDFQPITFVGFDFCSKIHTVDYWFGLIRIVTWFANCDGLINVFWGTAIVFFQRFFTPIDTNLFFSVCQIVRDPTRTNLFYDQVFMQYWIFADGRDA